MLANVNAFYIASIARRRRPGMRRDVWAIRRNALGTLGISTHVLLHLPVYLTFHNRVRDSQNTQEFAL